MCYVGGVRLSAHVVLDMIVLVQVEYPYAMSLFVRSIICGLGDLRLGCSNTIYVGKRGVQKYNS